MKSTFLSAGIPDGVPVCVVCVLPNLALVPLKENAAVPPTSMELPLTLKVASTVRLFRIVVVPP